MRLGLLLLFTGLRVCRSAERDVDLREHVGEFGLRFAVQFRMRIGSDKLLTASPQLPHSLLLLLCFEIARFQYQRLGAFGEAGQFAQQPISKLRCVDAQEESSRQPERPDGLRCQRRESRRRMRSRIPLHKR